MLDIHSRETICALWEKVASDKLSGLSHSEKQIVVVLLDHADKCGTAFEAGRRNPGYDFDSGNVEADPFFHVALHVAIEEQLDMRHPLEVWKLYNALRNLKTDRHAAAHVIASVFAPFVLNAWQTGMPIDSDAYLAQLDETRKTYKWKLRDAIESDFDYYREPGTYDPVDLCATESRQAKEELDMLIELVHRNGQAIPLRSRNSGIAVLVPLSDYVIMKQTDDVFQELMDELEEKSKRGADVLQFPGNADKKL